MLEPIPVHDTRRRIRAVDEDGRASAVRVAENVPLRDPDAVGRESLADDEEQASVRREAEGRRVAVFAPQRPARSRCRPGRQELGLRGGRRLHDARAHEIQQPRPSPAGGGRLVPDEFPAGRVEGEARRVRAHDRVRLDRVLSVRARDDEQRHAALRDELRAHSRCGNDGLVRDDLSGQRLRKSRHETVGRAAARQVGRRGRDLRGGVDRPVAVTGEHFEVPAPGGSFRQPGQEARALEQERHAARRRREGGEKLAEIPLAERGGGDIARPVGIHDGAAGQEEPHAGPLGHFGRRRKRDEAPIGRAVISVAGAVAFRDERDPPRSREHHGRRRAPVFAGPGRLRQQLARPAQELPALDARRVAPRDFVQVGSRKDRPVIRIEEQPRVSQETLDRLQRIVEDEKSRRVGPAPRRGRGGPGRRGHEDPAAAALEERHGRARGDSPAASEPVGRRLAEDDRSESHKGPCIGLVGAGDRRENEGRGEQAEEREEPEDRGDVAADHVNLPARGFLRACRRQFMVRAVSHSPAPVFLAIDRLCNTDNIA